jgi:tetratricopeptide (TPR) repeat protein
MKSDKKESKRLSRRELLMGPINRWRDRGESAAGPSGATQDALSADELLRQGRIEEAYQAYKAVLRADPNHLEARARLGYCLYLLGRCNQAVIEFNRVLKKRSDMFSWLYLGLCQTKRGRLPEAISAWKNYINPREVTISREINLQIALFETKDPDQTAAQALKAVEEALARRRQELAS